MSNLTEHAKRELEIAGMFDEDADYGGALGKAVMELIEKFDSQGHSGMSASIATMLFEKLVRYENLTELGTTDNEWNDVSEMSGTPMWQNKRRSTTFSRDAGKTWYDLNDPSLNNGDES